MTEPRPRPERRRDVRVAPKGTVVLRGGGHTVSGRVANLSRRGVSISTPAAPKDLLDMAVVLALRLDAALTSWQDLPGRVLRIDADSVAVELGVVPPSFLQIVDEAVSASWCHGRVLTVVLVDATDDRRSSMAEAFREVGCTVVDVSTPLEAIVRLGESDFEPALIAIADSTPAAISDELRRFVDAEHPRTRLVTIGDAEIARDGVVCWLSSALSPDRAARIISVLTTARRP